MRASTRLLSAAAGTASRPPRLPVHITLFTRASCALCTSARGTLAALWEKRPFEYAQIDVMATGGRWKDAYEFDVPVIHVARTVGEEEGGAVSERVKKLMHRFGEEEVAGVMDAVLREAAAEEAAEEAAEGKKA